MGYADPPGGKVGELAASTLSNPEREMREDLENFARKVERGELNLGGPEPRPGAVREVCRGGTVPSPSGNIEAVG